MRMLAAVIIAGMVLAGCYKETMPPKQAYLPKTHAQQLNNQAMESLKAGRTEESVTLLSQAIEEDPGFAVACLNKACALGRLGHFEEAVNLLGQATSIDAGLAEAYLFRGVFSERLNQTDDSLRSYAKAAELFGAKAKESPSAEAATARAIALYLGTGKVQGLEALNALIARYPDYSRARFLKEKILQGDRAYFMWWIADQNSR